MDVVTFSRFILDAASGRVESMAYHRDVRHRFAVSAGEFARTDRPTAPDRFPDDFAAARPDVQRRTRADIPLRARKAVVARG